jgi:hypothetical protein
LNLLTINGNPRSLPILKLQENTLPVWNTRRGGIAILSLRMNALVTRNTTFANRSRSYCLQAHIITQTQEGPVIHQRELATVAWLRTGLALHWIFREVI